ncbi:hypothetical protein CsSME_00010644 [Camellia sinensis var. sinensis]
MDGHRIVQSAPLSIEDQREKTRRSEFAQGLGEEGESERKREAREEEEKVMAVVADRSPVDLLMMMMR